MKPKLLEATLGGGRLLKRTSEVLIVAAFGAASLYGALSAFAAPPSKTAVDAENASYAQMMLDEGKKLSATRRSGARPSGVTHFSCIKPLPVRKMAASVRASRQKPRYPLASRSMQTRCRTL